MITWRPIVETVYMGERTGYVELPHQSTHALPRLGERVTFPDQEICNALKLKHGVWDGGPVTGVSHIVDGAQPDVWILVEIPAQYDATRTAKYAKVNEIKWSRYDPALPTRAQAVS